MVSLRTTASRTSPPNDDESFLAPASIRQPADEMGPRAQRTVARIIEATREVFLTRGYAGTTIDEIARIADVSRASFYTYFPSKREVLIATGASAASECEALLEMLPARSTSRAGLTEWVARYFDLLDVHGSFAFAWTQAAQEDEEIRVVGMRRHYGLCKKFGSILLASAKRASDKDAGPLGVVAFSTLERAWSYGQVYAEAVDRNALIRQTANALWGAARQPGA